jgi:hypothetical protein
MGSGGTTSSSSAAESPATDGKSPVGVGLGGAGRADEQGRGISLDEESTEASPPPAATGGGAAGSPPTLGASECPPPPTGVRSPEQGRADGSAAGIVESPPGKRLCRPTWQAAREVAMGGLNGKTRSKGRPKPLLRSERRGLQGRIGWAPAAGEDVECATGRRGADVDDDVVDVPDGEGERWEEADNPLPTYPRRRWSSAGPAAREPDREDVPKYETVKMIQYQDGWTEPAVGDCGVEGQEEKKKGDETKDKTDDGRADAGRAGMKTDAGDRGEAVIWRPQNPPVTDKQLAAMWPPKWPPDEKTPEGGPTPRVRFGPVEVREVPSRSPKQVQRARRTVARGGTGSGSGPGWCPSTWMPYDGRGSDGRERRDEGEMAARDAIVCRQPRDDDPPPVGSQTSLLPVEADPGAVLPPGTTDWFADGRIDEEYVCAQHPHGPARGEAARASERLACGDRSPSAAERRDAVDATSGEARRPGPGPAKVVTVEAKLTDARRLQGDESPASRAATPDPVVEDGIPRMVLEAVADHAAEEWSAMACRGCLQTIQPEDDCRFCDTEGPDHFPVCRRCAPVKRDPVDMLCPGHQLVGQLPEEGDPDEELRDSKLGSLGRRLMRIRALAMGATPTALVNYPAVAESPGDADYGSLLAAARAAGAAVWHADRRRGLLGPVRRMIALAKALHACEAEAGPGFRSLAAAYVARRLDAPMSGWQPCNAATVASDLSRVAAALRDDGHEVPPYGAPVARALLAVRGAFEKRAHSLKCPVTARMLLKVRPGAASRWWPAWCRATWSALWGSRGGFASGVRRSDYRQFAGGFIMAWAARTKVVRGDRTLGAEARVEAWYVGARAQVLTELWAAAPNVGKMFTATGADVADMMRALLPPPPDGYPPYTAHCTRVGMDTVLMARGAPVDLIESILGWARMRRSSGYYAAVSLAAMFKATEVAVTTDVRPVAPGLFAPPAHGYEPVDWTGSALPRLPSEQGLWEGVPVVPPGRAAESDADGDDDEEVGHPARAAAGDFEALQRASAAGTRRRGRRPQ